jgi:hypothetical protein
VITDFLVPVVVLTSLSGTDGGKDAGLGSWAAANVALLGAITTAVAVSVVVPSEVFR